MKKLFYVRHGETHMNVREQFAGQIETPLTERGREQAILAGKKAQQSLPKIDLIVASPYERASHTAEYIAKEISYPVESILYNDLLIERSFGVLEGTDALPFRNPGKHLEIDHIESVETIEQLQKRAQKAFKFIQSLTQYDNILIVGHGTFGRALRRVIGNIPHTEEYEKYKLIKNAEIIELI